MTIPQQTPTLVDVAALAGVSTATVSRCLNAPDRVVAKTRDRVMSAVAALGYSPNFGARVMAAKRTQTIGAIIPTMENAIFARGLQAFQDALAQHGYTLLVASSSYRADQEEAQIRALVARGADGILLIGHERGAGIHEFLATQNVPAVVAWAFDPSQPLASIGFDNAASMEALVTQVLRLGHRRLGMIAAEDTNNDRAAERLRGARRAISAAGLDQGALRVMKTPYSIENGASAFGQLMAQATPPTAIMCGNDVLAVGAMRRARELGLQVPHDVSITGFDDIELAQVVYPALTTVHVPHRDMGRLAAEVLIGMVRDGLPARSILLPADVVIRGSLGPPKRPA